MPSLAVKALLIAALCSFGGLVPFSTAAEDATPSETALPDEPEISDATVLSPDTEASSAMIDVPCARRLVHVPDTDIGFKKRAGTAGFVYAACWGAYVATQYDNIRLNGSFKNWYRNMSQLHFDNDSYDYNIIQHSLAGSYYYMFYRSRGFKGMPSIFMTAASVAMFEFAVETTTEIPSIQDLYLTTILGSLLGICMENTSLWLHDQGHLETRLLGWALDPFTWLDASAYEVRCLPLIQDDSAGMWFNISF